MLELIIALRCRIKRERDLLARLKLADACRDDRFLQHPAYPVEICPHLGRNHRILSKVIRGREIEACAILINARDMAVNCLHERFEVWFLTARAESNRELPGIQSRLAVQFGNELACLEIERLPLPRPLDNRPHQSQPGKVDSKR